MVYDGDRQLHDAFAEVVAVPLCAVDVVVVLATPAHRAGFDAALRASGVDLDAVRAAGRYVEIDAAEQLAALWVDGELDPRRLVPMLARHEEAARRAGGRLHVFGELVALLWDRGLTTAAIALEEVWNHLHGVYDFDLICGHPTRAFAGDAEAYAQVCARHTRVVGDVPVPAPRVVDLAVAESCWTPTDAADTNALEGSSAWLRAITDRMADGLCTLDRDGRITHVNPHGARLLQTATVAATGGSFVNRLVGVHADGTPRQLHDLAIGAEFDGVLPVEPAQDRLIRPDGSLLPIEYVATPLPADPDGPGDGWVVFFRDITNRLAREQVLGEQVDQARWMTRIQDALDNDRFVLFAQPIVDIGTGHQVQQELLLRLDDPEEGLILPAAFLPSAEASGLAPAIDRWVLSRGIDIASRGHRVDINLSARSLDDPALVRFIARLLADSGADPGDLVFEITETALIENDQAAYRFARGVRDLGCKVALDDFGTGYSTLTYLKSFPVDILKIDREFIRDAVDETPSRQIISAIVSLAQAFGLVTVAEGVEDRATFNLLARLGVDQAQGYLLGRPAPLPPTLTSGPNLPEVARSTT